MSLAGETVQGEEGGRRPEAEAVAGSGTVLYELREVKRAYDEGRIPALRGVSLEIGAGEFVSIVGPSGSGKSTLLQLLGALDAPSEGTMRYAGEPMPTLDGAASFRAREVGFIFQSFHLLPTFTALENVQMPMFEGRWRPAERTRRAVELLESVGLGHRLNQRPAKLSGGERQRVAIARSLANEPRVLLADEPTGNLDSGSAAQVMELLEDLHRQRQVTLIMVTHDLSLAMRAPRVISIADGLIQRDGPSADFAANTHLAEQIQPASPS